MSRARLLLAVTAAVLGGLLLHAQGTAPASPLVLLSREGRRPLPTRIQNGQEYVALSDLAAAFGATAGEDAIAGGVTISHGGRTAVISTDRPMASVEGRLVPLPAAAFRAGDRWFVPIEFVSRAFASIYGQRIELRAASRLLIVGDLRVPRVTARIESPGPPTRVAIDISPAIAATASHEGSQVVVSIEADAIDPVLPESGAGLVQQIRPGDRPTSIVVLLRGAGAVSTTTAPTATGTRLTIEVQAPGAPAGTPPAPVEETPPPAVEGPAPFALPRPALQTIVLDPGHGGEDTGIAGPSGTREKDVTLDVARRVRTLLETRLGVRVLLTRDEDRQVGIDERAAVANNSKADLFVSLHANAALVPSVSGAEVFYLALDPEAEAASRLAQAASVRLPVLGGGTRTIDVIRWDMAQAGHLESSAALAATLEQALRERVPLGPRPLQRAPLRVLVGVNMPAVLVEMAYLTNPADERRAASADFQAALAQAVYEAVLRFRSHLEEQR